MSATSPGAFRRGAQDPLLSLNEEDFVGYETLGSFAETAEDLIGASFAFEYASGLLNDSVETVDPMFLHLQTSDTGVVADPPAGVTLRP
ncbi:hypothetical protein CPLU01_11141 [Colletotrichum plurivorum]|uniref:Uncharacterized protein n=1 Tax=Colletotrichum plurivorum TaxID=2175906 RepID=A0A8H6K2P1_9PEZI|nr:hypothetical protein CPLU01_11141 [Colletotrichum plurivorum]